MCGPRRELDGDPDAMRRFGGLVDALRAPGVSGPGPAPGPCAGGMRGCAVFTAADFASTAALTGFLAETDEAISALGAAAALSALDYLATDLSGALGLLGATRGDATPEV